MTAEKHSKSPFSPGAKRSGAQFGSQSTPVTLRIAFLTRHPAFLDNEQFTIDTHRIDVPPASGTLQQRVRNRPVPNRVFEPASASVHPVRSRRAAWPLVGVVPVNVAVDLLVLGFAPCPSDLQAWLALPDACSVRSMRTLVRRLREHHFPCPAWLQFSRSFTLDPDALCRKRLCRSERVDYIPFGFACSALDCTTPSG